MTRATILLILASLGSASAQCTASVNDMTFWKQLVNPCGQRHHRRASDVQMPSRYEIRRTAWLIKLQVEDLLNNDNAARCDGLSLVSLPQMRRNIVAPLYESLFYHAAHVLFVGREHALFPLSCIHDSESVIRGFTRLGAQLLHLQCLMLHSLSSFDAPKRQRFHFHGECSSRQTRDCVVLAHTLNLLRLIIKID